MDRKGVEKNLNRGYYNNLDENFEQAFEMSEKNFTHEELISLLKYGNIAQKQIAALKFDYVNNSEDAKILLSNLTGCDGKIREAVALKINQILNNFEDTKLFFSSICAETLADASIDINANICRLAVDSAILLKDNNDFSTKYVSKLIKFLNEALKELDKFIFRDKKYIINKQVFKLYWCLEGIKYFQEFIDEKELERILTVCSEQKEYTIREKAAQIISISNKYQNLKNKFLNDENYYVRAALN